MSATMVLPTKEQELFRFMNRSFFPPWKVIETTDGLSEEISCYFMGGNIKKDKTEEKKGEKKGEMEKHGQGNFLPSRCRGLFIRG
jgi:hypothetical protein